MKSSLEFPAAGGHQVAQKSPDDFAGPIALDIAAPEYRGPVGEEPSPGLLRADDR